MGEKLNRYLDSLAFKHLSKRRKTFLHYYPQVACYAFDHIGAYINCFGRYELNELNGLSKIFSALKGTDALDVGANIGNHSLFFSEFFNRVHSFEPNPRTFELLKFNIEGRPNISIYKHGASNHDGIVSAYSNPANIGGASIATGFEEQSDKIISIEFEVKQLDGVEELNGIKRIGFIKMDVEGHEVSALQGMRNLITKHKPKIAFEHDGNEPVEKKTSVVSSLQGMGYSYFYEIKVVRTKIPHFVPNIIKLPLRLLEILTTDFPKVHIERLEKIESKFYHMIIASTSEIKVR